MSRAEAMRGKRKGGVKLALSLVLTLSSLAVLKGENSPRNSFSGSWPAEGLVSLFPEFKPQGLEGRPLFGRIDLFQTKVIPSPPEEDILGREAIRVAVIDSGLGGLSIMAEAAGRLEKTRFYRRVNLVFFNALFSPEKGYNALPRREARVEMLDKVLASLEKKFNPDLILIACNTLSTLYSSTLFSRQAKIPVFDIVQPGVSLLSQELRKNPEAVALILATPVTIDEDSHRKALLRLGFPSQRLFVQACPELELFIEKDAEGEETGLLISGFLEEGLQKLAKPWPPVIISLNCTHYEYSLPLWEKAARESGLASFSIVSPNSSLLGLWLKPELRPRFEKTTVKATVFSRVEIEEKTRKNIAAHLRKISPEVAEALLNYVLDPDLF